MKKHDTLDINDRLEKSGFNAEQARVITKVFQETSNMLEDNMFEKLDSVADKINANTREMFVKLDSNIKILDNKLDTNKWLRIYDRLAIPMTGIGIAAAVIFAAIHG